MTAGAILVEMTKLVTVLAGCVLTCVTVLAGAVLTRVLVMSCVEAG